MRIALIQDFDLGIMSSRWSDTGVSLVGSAPTYVCEDEYDCDRGEGDDNNGNDGSLMRNVNPGQEEKWVKLTLTKRYRGLGCHYDKNAIVRIPIRAS